MNRHAFVLAAMCGAAALLVGIKPIRAADGDAIYAQIETSMSGASSYVATSVFGGMTTVTTILRVPDEPAWIKTSISADLLHIESYTLGRQQYLRADGGPWRQFPLSETEYARAVASLMPGMRPAPAATLLPDCIVGGKTYGALRLTTIVPASVRVNMPGAPAALALDCTYDKTALRLHACAGQHFVMTFQNFNDPANLFELPAAAANAIAVSSLSAAIRSLLPSGAASSPPR